MTTMTTDISFSDSIPAAYQSYMVPLIFEPYAVDISERVFLQSPQKILEIAAGTGVVTQQLLSRLGPEGQLVATDLNQSMLSQAQQNIHDPRIDWRQCNAVSLPFQDQKFDAVVCQFGAMFFPDRVQAYQEARRVLTYDGRVYMNVWDQIVENEFADEVEKTLANLFPQDSPRFMSKTPHGYFDAGIIRSDFEAAGFSKIKIETVSFTSKAPSARFVATAFCTGTPLRTELEAREEHPLQEVISLVSAALVARFGSGEIQGKIQALVIETSKERD